MFGYRPAYKKLSTTKKSCQELQTTAQLIITVFTVAHALSHLPTKVGGACTHCSTCPCVLSPSTFFCVSSRLPLTTCTHAGTCTHQLVTWPCTVLAAYSTPTPPRCSLADALHILGFSTWTTQGRHVLRPIHYTQTNN